jgi:hypothetical protein
MSAPPRDKDRCEFVFEDGRRCRRLRRAPGARFCQFHWLRHQREDEEAALAGEEIIAAAGSLDSEEAIHKAIGNVFRQLAHHKISARNAAVLGYLGQLMMGKCPSLDRMLQSYLPMLQFAMKTRQQMDRSDANADRHERHLVELQFDLLDRILLLLRSDQLKDMPAEARREIAEALKSAMEKKGKSASAKA